MICVSYTRTMSCSLMEKVPSDIISRQNERIAKYASARKWKIEKKYSDRKQDRNEDTAFRSLKEDGISGKFDLVVMDSIYRFGTTVYHAYDVLALVFLPAEIHFAVVEDNFCSADCPQEEVLTYLKNKRMEYRKLHSKETTGHKLENRVYEKYGYRHKDGVMELVIDEEAAENIRMIFSLICEGKTLKQTATIMNERGIEPPNMYMKRIGINKSCTGKSEWIGSQIRNIISNTIYMGEWVRTINCEKVIVPCPAIVSAEVSRKAKESLLAKQKASRAISSPINNALSGIFYDYDSGWEIFQYRTQSTGEKIFRLRYPKPDELDYPKMLISYDEVIGQVRELLLQEQEKAKTAIRAFATPKFAKYKEGRINELREQAQEVYRRMLQIEFAAWKENSPPSDVAKVQSENDVELQALLDKIEETETLLSAENPWVKLYANMKLPKELTSKDLKPYITSATLEKFETVRVQIKEIEAYLQLPQILWMEE